MATENAAPQVTVGERSITIARFRGFKALTIAEAVAEIARAYPELASKAAEFESTYIEENKLILTRPEVDLRYGEDSAQISDEAWQETEGKYELKRMPSAQERLAAMWPEILVAAKDPAMRLLAIVSLSNEELRDADEADRVAEAIEERRKELLHDGEPDQLVELFVKGAIVAQEQFAPLVERAEPLLAKMGLTMGSLEQMMSSTSSPKDEGEASPDDSRKSPTSQSSSTASPPPTAGGESKPSGPPGQPSADSPSD